MLGGLNPRIAPSGSGYAWAQGRSISRSPEEEKGKLALLWASKTNSDSDDDLMEHRYDGTKMIKVNGYELSGIV